MKISTMNRRLYETLSNISMHCPQAMATYLICLNRADANLELDLTDDNINIDLSYECDKFVSDVKALAREGLLEWYPYDGGIRITMADG